VWEGESPSGRHSDGGRLALARGHGGSRDLWGAPRSLSSIFAVTANECRIHGECPVGVCLRYGRARVIIHPMWVITLAGTTRLNPMACRTLLSATRLQIRSIGRTNQNGDEENLPLW
jgi:hypothetical protein